MEKVLTLEEKIKRAEEIYNKRRMEGERNRTAKVSVNSKKDYMLFKKMIIQILICFVIYFIYYLIQNTDYIFSDEVINKTKQVLSYDINFGEEFNNLKTYLTENKENEFEENRETENQIENNIVEVENGIGGANENKEPINDETAQKQENLTDAEYIKNKYSFIKPVNGTITSEFGNRNPTNKSVPKNHTGIDIAAPLGTEILSATDGMVILVSEQGDYRKTFKNKQR